MFDEDSNFYTWYEITHMVDCGVQQLQLVQTYAHVDFQGITIMYESKKVCVGSQRTNREYGTKLCKCG